MNRARDVLAWIKYVEFVAARARVGRPPYPMHPPFGFRLHQELVALGWLDFTALAFRDQAYERRLIMDAAEIDAQRVDVL